RRWLFHSRETANFTYHLDPANMKYLAAFVANITSHKPKEIEEYLEELETDTDLQAHVRHTCECAIAANPFRYADPEARYGRRLGWYGLARVLKPRVVVETGIDKGLGSLVLTLALMRNSQEGYPGYYYGTDIDPGAGYLFTAPYTQYGSILRGDS